MSGVRPLAAVFSSAAVLASWAAEAAAATSLFRAVMSLLTLAIRSSSRASTAGRTVKLPLAISSPSLSRLRSHIR